MTRLMAEQVLPYRTDHDKADTPEAREARIVALCEKYERLGLTGERRPKPTLTPEQQAKRDAIYAESRARNRRIVELHQSGVPDREISEQVGRSLGRVRVILFEWRREGKWGSGRDETTLKCTSCEIADSTSGVPSSLAAAS